MNLTVSGFSRKTKEEKIQWLSEHYLQNDPSCISILKQYWNEQEDLQNLHDDFIENTLSNFYLPFAVSPNFLINGKMHVLPMVIEESSVVAAASNAAKFWLERGGFKSEVKSIIKNGQIHIKYLGDDTIIQNFFKTIKSKLLKSIDEIENNMKNRGGGLLDVELIHSNDILEGYHQLYCTFDTLDAMGANFINSCLEKMAKTFEELSLSYKRFNKDDNFPEVVMSILSNYVPECIVRAEVSCPTEQLSDSGLDGRHFAEKFLYAIDIAKTEPRRAVTHNKGIMNGVDAVVLATGNDFRAVEAGVHAYASRNGNYTSLTDASIDNGQFTFWIEIPLAIGTVGGLTRLHPMVSVAHKILKNPNAQELMQLIAVAGLAQNFAAIRSLVTTGIQKGHMKMHLMNILNQLGTTENETAQVLRYFSEKTISYSEVVRFVEHLRN
jgi:hydroxymethylglutaryl-CoA reductase